MKFSYTKSCERARFIFFAFLFFALSSQAQVGIGNTNPDASSMLDITSTSKGLLLPRMTSAQRLAITTPANSLLVYDTTIKAYYYYDTVSSTWVKINSALNQRNNYVLVKTAADLPAPSGGKITLVSNTLYEINGLITITAPIDLNDAYVAGLDANEDVISFPGGVVFKGNTGGSIRNVTLKGAKAFEITGPGISSATSLLVQNTIVDGMTTSVGSISGLGLYFGNIIQFINNTNGITYTNIGNLLLNNQAWLSTNSGTFEKFTGNFSLIEKASGFSTVPSGAIGLDVSTTGLAVANGVLNGTVFSGTGTYINRYTTGSYTGYNFTNAWSVNCPGIPRESDDVSTGDINFSAAVGSGQVTSFTGTGSGSRTKVQGTTTSNNLFRFEKVGDNRITYKGAKKRFFQVTASVSYQSTADITLILYIAKNGTVIDQTKVYSKGTTGYFVTDQGILAVPIVGTVELNNNDYIEIWAERYAGSGNMNTVSLNLTAR
ncbi:hypothetical protein A7A78_11130 [Aequorivita soesokkakensis]|uniref:Cell wall anchor protein n=1 Tax=Aequorivita soesokkakensis TaxID=1385699 RepID=A0A1A9LFE0_9FLAO|nr:hypothetical protein [Aequorivita soesokkakensis]OAD91797.1 hypothetical protein A7A78_11130 [Aequorivita soesokkakensis]